MGRTYDQISGKLREWIEGQPLFFVGTAPSGTEGHINISPKGARGSFAILDSRTVAYVDMTGSGVETIAHLRDNGRIVLMFCAFEGPPKIIRLHGQGHAVFHQEPEFAAGLAHFELSPDVRALARAIVVVEVSRISDSCGYTIPIMEFVRERDQLFRWAEAREAKQGPNWWADYKREKNTASIDGLPGIDPAAAPAPDLVTAEG